jgi:hypothetical protein
MLWKSLLMWATGQINDALRQQLEFALQESPSVEFLGISGRGIFISFDKSDLGYRQ